MEPIVSPWLIYVISVVSKINHIAAILFVASLIVCGVSAVFGCILADYIFEQENKYRNTILRWATKVFIISAIVVAITPGKETLIAMLSAHYITPENIQAVQGNIVDFVRQIMDAAHEGSK